MPSRAAVNGARAVLRNLERDQKTLAGVIDLNVGITGSIQLMVDICDQFGGYLLFSNLLVYTKSDPSSWPQPLSSGPAATAVKAAEAVADYLGGRDQPSRQDIDELAEIIDREARISDLVVALGGMRDFLCEYRNPGPSVLDALDRQLTTLEDEPCSHAEKRMGFPPE